MKVICNAAGFCSEEICGAKDFHEYDPKECGHCPKNKDAECIEIYTHEEAMKKLANKFRKHIKIKT